MGLTLSCTFKHCNRSCEAITTIYLSHDYRLVGHVCSEYRLCQRNAILPEHWQFHDTQNEQEIRKLFSNIKVWPLLFLNIVIITPIVEELLFRHLLIHELGKKLSYPVMSIISILLFAGIHVTDATSPFEIGPYLIMATSFVVAYNMSGRNLAVTIALHSFNNLLSFILTLLQFL